MSARILQLNFKFDLSPAEYEAAVSPLAGDFAEVPGLQWKVWLMNELDLEAGGIYVFDDQASLDAYLEGELAAVVMAHPALTDFEAKQFDVMDAPTAVTRGPIGVGGAA